jgi:Xaa-Pro aminopeptidase
VTIAPPDLHRARHRALCVTLARLGLDALLVTHPPNIAYLTGFFGSAGVGLVSADLVVLLSDGRYHLTLQTLERMHEGQLATRVVPAGQSLDEIVAAELLQLAPARLGFEAHALTVRAHADLRRRLAVAGSPVELVGVDTAVESLRLVKDAWEVANFRDAGARLFDVAKCILPKALSGVIESKLAAEIEWELRRAGFEKPAFDTIVASGPNAALPHYRAGDRALETGDFVVIDFGGMLNGYAVDMTRTVTVGLASARQQQLLDAVAAAQLAAFEAVEPGVAAEVVDAAARGVLEAGGLGDAFGHGLGHGLGLEVHERPRLARRRAGVTQDALAPGAVFTLEPGVYFPGWGGVRIEDDVLATRGGGEWLTRSANQ